MTVTACTIVRTRNFAAAICIVLVGGCGSSHEAPPSVEASALLDILQEDTKRHDPQTFVEMDLGEFRVTRALGEDGTLMVRFHLYGVLPEVHLVEFQEKLSHFDKRMRDTVLGIVQSCEQSELTTPRMGLLKSQIRRAINEMLRSRALRDVVVSDLTIDRG